MKHPIGVKQFLEIFFNVINNERISSDWVDHKQINCSSLRIRASVFSCFLLPCPGPCFWLFSGTAIDHLLSMCFEITLSLTSKRQASLMCQFPKPPAKPKSRPEAQSYGRPLFPSTVRLPPYVPKHPKQAICLHLHHTHPKL